MITDSNNPGGLSSTTRKRTGHNSRKTESAFAQITIPTNIHTANIMLTTIILMTDKHTIPKGNMESNNCRLLPDHIVCKIIQRNNILRRSNTCAPAHKLLNEEITFDIPKHKQILWREHLDIHWDHRHTTHIIWKTIQGKSNRTPPSTLNTSITCKNTQTYCELFQQTIHQHCQTRNTQDKHSH